jgi:hypothetical protein
MSFSVGIDMKKSFEIFKEAESINQNVLIQTFKYDKLNLSILLKKLKNFK